MKEERNNSNRGREKPNSFGDGEKKKYKDMTSLLQSQHQR